MLCIIPLFILLLLLLLLMLLLLFLLLSLLMLLLLLLLLFLLLLQFCSQLSCFCLIPQTLCDRPKNLVTKVSFAWCIHKSTQIIFKLNSVISLVVVLYRKESVYIGWLLKKPYSSQYQKMWLRSRINTCFVRLCNKKI